MREEGQVSNGNDRSSGFKTFKIVDANYRAVAQNLDKVLLEYPNFCGCEECKCKVIATALNYLSPHYYVEGVEKNGGDLSNGSSSASGLVENAIRIGIAETVLFSHQ